MKDNTFCLSQKRQESNKYLNLTVTIRPNMHLEGVREGPLI